MYLFCTSFKLEGTFCGGDIENYYFFICRPHLNYQSIYDTYRTKHLILKMVDQPIIQTQHILKN